MKIFITALLVFAAFTSLTAQTRLIAHRSHSGNNKSFISATVGNFGLYVPHPGDSIYIKRQEIKRQEIKRLEIEKQELKRQDSIRKQSERQRLPITRNDIQTQAIKVGMTAKIRP